MDVLKILWGIVILVSSFSSSPDEAPPTDYIQSQISIIDHTNAIPVNLNNCDGYTTLLPQCSNGAYGIRASFHRQNALADLIISFSLTTASNTEYLREDMFLPKAKDVIIVDFPLTTPQDVDLDVAIKTASSAENHCEAVLNNTLKAVQLDMELAASDCQSNFHDLEVKVLSNATEPQTIRIVADDLLPIMMTTEGAETVHVFENIPTSILPNTTRNVALYNIDGNCPIAEDSYTAPQDCCNTVTSSADDPNCEISTNCEGSSITPTTDEVCGTSNTYSVQINFNTNLPNGGEATISSDDGHFQAKKVSVGAGAKSAGTTLSISKEILTGKYTITVEDDNCGTSYHTGTGQYSRPSNCIPNSCSLSISKEDENCNRNSFDYSYAVTRNNDTGTSNFYVQLYKNSNQVSDEYITIEAGSNKSATFSFTGLSLTDNYSISVTETSGVCEGASNSLTITKPTDCEAYDCNHSLFISINDMECTGNTYQFTSFFRRTATSSSADFTFILYEDGQVIDDKGEIELAAGKDKSNIYMFLGLIPTANYELVVTEIGCNIDRRVKPPVPDDCPNCSGTPINPVTEEFEPEDCPAGEEYKINISFTTNLPNGGRADIVPENSEFTAIPIEDIPAGEKEYDKTLSVNKSIAEGAYNINVYNNGCGATPYQSGRGSFSRPTECLPNCSDKEAFSSNPVADCTDEGESYDVTISFNADIPTGGYAEIIVDNPDIETPDDIPAGSDSQSFLLQNLSRSEIAGSGYTINIYDDDCTGVHQSSEGEFSRPADCFSEQCKLSVVDYHINENCSTSTFDFNYVIRRFSSGYSGSVNYTITLYRNGVLVDEFKENGNLVAGQNTSSRIHWSNIPTDGSYSISISANTSDGICNVENDFLLPTIDCDNKDCEIDICPISVICSGNGYAPQFSFSRRYSDETTTYRYLVYNDNNTYGTADNVELATGQFESPLIDLSSQGYTSAQNLKIKVITLNGNCQDQFKEIFVGTVNTNNCTISGGSCNEVQDCGLTIVSATPTQCTDNTYDLSIEVRVDGGVANTTHEVTTQFDGQSASHGISTNQSYTFTISELSTSSVANETETIFVSSPTCGNTSESFTIPTNCGAECSVSIVDEELVCSIDGYQVKFTINYSGSSDFGITVYPDEENHPAVVDYPTYPNGTNTGTIEYISTQTFPYGIGTIHPRVTITGSGCEMNSSATTSLIRPEAEEECSTDDPNPENCRINSVDLMLYCEEDGSNSIDAAVNFYTPEPSMANIYFQLTDNSGIIIGEVAETVGQSPAQFRFSNDVISPDMEVNINAQMSHPSCDNVVFTSNQQLGGECANDCRLTFISASPKGCGINGYSLDINVVFEGGGPFDFTLNHDGQLSSHSLIESPTLITLEGVRATGTGRVVEVSGQMANSGGCTTTATTTYRAPGDCTTICGRLESFTAFSECGDNGLFNVTITGVATIGNSITGSVAIAENGFVWNNEGRPIQIYNEADNSITYQTNYGGNSYGPQFLSINPLNGRGQVTFSGLEMSSNSYEVFFNPSSNDCENPQIQRLVFNAPEDCCSIGTQEEIAIIKKECNGNNYDLIVEVPFSSETNTALDATIRNYPQLVPTLSFTNEIATIEFTNIPTDNIKDFIDISLSDEYCSNASTVSLNYAVPQDCISYCEVGENHSITIGCSDVAGFYGVILDVDLSDFAGESIDYRVEFSNSNEFHEVTDSETGTVSTIVLDNLFPYSEEQQSMIIYFTDPKGNCQIEPVTLSYLPSDQIINCCISPSIVTQQSCNEDGTYNLLFQVNDIPRTIVTFELYEASNPNETPLATGNSPNEFRPTNLIEGVQYVIKYTINYNDCELENTYSYNSSDDDCEPLPPSPQCNDFIGECMIPILEKIAKKEECEKWEGEDVIKRGGKVSIGTKDSPPNGYNLAVKGGIRAGRVQVELCGGNWCDYVFEEGYHLLPLIEVEQFIQNYYHLPDMPAAEEIEKAGGIEMKTMTLLQQQKIEELFLHLLDVEQQWNLIKNCNFEENISEFDIRSKRDIFPKQAKTLDLLLPKQANNFSSSEEILVNCDDEFIECLRPFFEFMITGTNACSSSNWEGAENTTGTITSNGSRVNIGGDSNDYTSFNSLIVTGGVITDRACIGSNDCIGGLRSWGDYVFDRDYNLWSLNKVDQHIAEKGYLNGMPAGKTIEDRGSFELGDIAYRQQVKIEELFLYMIQLEEEISTLEQQIND